MLDRIPRCDYLIYCKNLIEKGYRIDQAAYRPGLFLLKSCKSATKVAESMPCYRLVAGKLQ